MASTGADYAPRTSFEHDPLLTVTNLSPNSVSRRNTKMSVAQPKELDRAAAMPSDSERLVDQLANRIGGLGVELADVAGNLQEVAGRVANQSERVGHLQKTAETMGSANHHIAGASRAVQAATSAAVGEITQSRAAVETAVQHISELIAAVG